MKNLKTDEKFKSILSKLIQKIKLNSLKKMLIIQFVGNSLNCLSK